MYLSFGNTDWKLLLLLQNLCKGLSIPESALGSPGSMSEWRARAAEPRQSENLHTGLTWGEWRTICCSVHLSLLLLGGSCWPKKFIFQRTGVSHWLSQGPTSLRQKDRASGLLYPKILQEQQKQHGTHAAFTCTHAGYWLPFLLLGWKSMLKTRIHCGQAVEQGVLGCRMSGRDGNTENINITKYKHLRANRQQRYSNSSLINIKLV